MSISVVETKLSDHFTFEQLTRTDLVQYQELNRKINEVEREKLIECALLLEECRNIIGGDLDIHSGRRCQALNDAVGSSDKSQHLKCEAIDFSPAGHDTQESIDSAFALIINAYKVGKIKFGQLISESVTGNRENKKYWIHISLGVPYRVAARCNQVLKMKNGVYTTVEV